MPGMRTFLTENVRPGRQVARVGAPARLPKVEVADGQDGEGAAPTAGLIASDDSRIAAALRQIVRIVTAHGGVVHPGAVILERDGAMAVHNRQVAASDDLFQLPRKLLVPVSGVRWAQDQTTLALDGDPEGLTPVQRDLLECHVELFNACGKVPTLARIHPAVALGPQAALVRAIQAVKPKFRAGHSSAAEGLLGCRTLGLKALDDGESRDSVIMPLVELMNHHANGAPYRVDQRGLRIRVVHPRDTSECFALYGAGRDPMDLALNYAFVDPDPQLAVSAPVAVDVPGVGRLRVTGRPPAKTSQAIPPVTRNADGMCVAWLVFASARPDRSTAFVRMALQAALAQAGVAPEVAARRADGAIAGLIEANLELLTEIRRQAELAQATGSPNPAACLVADAAAVQASIIAACVPYR